MKIGIAAEKSGVPSKTIRYYESIGLIPSTERAGNGYRVYHDKDVRTLRFIGCARSLGFPIEDIAQLLALRRKRKRKSAEVKSLALKHVKQIDRKLRELERLKQAVVGLVKRCRGDHRPDCPIIDELIIGERSAPAEHSRGRAAANEIRLNGMRHHG